MKQRSIKPLPTTKRERVVIGENMRRIKVAAKALNARYYQAWTIDPFDSALAMRRNRAWIKRKIKEGYDIFDIGIDPNRVNRSPFYAMKKQTLKDAIYPVIMVF